MLLKRPNSLKRFLKEKGDVLAVPLFGILTGLKLVHSYLAAVASSVATGVVAKVGACGVAAVALFVAAAVA